MNIVIFLSHIIVPILCAHGWNTSSQNTDARTHIDTALLTFIFIMCGIGFVMCFHGSHGRNTINFNAANNAINDDSDDSDDD